MIKIKMLNLAITRYGTFTAGQVVDIPDDLAKSWVKAGLAEPELSETLSPTKQNTKFPPPESFFCQACLEDKPASEASPDPRYCQGCYDFLLKEANLLPTKSCRPEWIPQAQKENKNPPTLSQHSRGIMSTLNDQKSEVDLIKVSVAKTILGKRGRKCKPLPQELITQWAGEGMGSKAIASRLKRELGVRVSYKTVQRALNASDKAKEG